MLVPDRALFDVQVWNATLAKYAAVTGLTIMLYDASGRPVCGPVNPTSLFELFARYGYDSGLFAQCCTRCLTEATRCCAVVAKSPHGLGVFGAPVTLKGEIVGAVVGGYVLTEFPQAGVVARFSQQTGIPLDTIWPLIQRQQPIREAQLLLRGELLQVLADTLVTEQHRAEAARQKDEFLAMLGHELRNPLAPIRTALELLQRFGVQHPTAVRAHGVIDRQVTHMVRLIDDLLEVSRITTGVIRLNIQEVDLMDVVADAVDSTRPLIEARHHRLDTSLPRAPLVVRGDRTRLMQVLTNLLNNAAKYTDEGGTIRITAAPHERQAVLRVIDTGTGISARLLPKVFDLFTQDDRTLDRAQGGLGVGLTLVRRITELHGGSVEAYSEGRGQGSEFVVKLPLHIAETVAPPAEAQPAQDRSERRLRCLVVDDNVDATQMLEVALKLEGHDVRVAFDGRDAVDAAASYRPDVIVLDIGLPRMNGYDVARTVRQLPGLANVLIIAATGYGQDGHRQKSREAGFDHHLVKPIELDALLRALVAGRRAIVDT